MVNRKIKFRVWDKWTRTMYIPTKVRGSISLINAVLSETPENLTVMQYTGLKDQNGVGIYEGDIVDFWGRKFLVIYNLGGFGCFGLNETWHPLGDTIYRPTTVIGNRFENPELMEETK